jgi:hypothetical protein
MNCLSLRRFLSLLAVCLLSFPFTDVRATSPSFFLDQNPKPTRHLIICVDGVGFSTIEKMRAEGKFPSFRNPARMIAPFPTLTNVAMTEILGPVGATEAAGYEDNFYDVGSNKMRGGLLDRFNNKRFIDGTFRELFDYHPSAIKSGLGYALPPLSTYLEAVSDLVRLKQKFKSSSEPVFFAYLGSTDSLSHLGGESMVRSFLSMLDDFIDDEVKKGGGQVRVSIFSDHGNHYRKYKRVSIKAPLRQAGFRLHSKIKDARSVVLPQFGLIGSALLFTKSVNESRLAQVTGNIRGVDFAAFEEDGLVWITNRNGRAFIERQDGKYRYVSQGGDPFGLIPLVQQMKTDGRADKDSFIAQSDWFAVTIDGPRPDVVRRVYEGLTENIQNRANVIVSFEDGYYSGSYALDIFAFLQATHGNVMREQSFGFAMTTANDLPKYLAAGDTWAAIGSPELDHEKLAGK